MKGVALALTTVVGTLAGVAAWLAPGPAPAAAPPQEARQDPGPRPAPDKTFTLTLDGAPLEDLIELVSAWTGKVFLFPDRLKNLKIFSKGKRAFRGEDLLGVFHAVLELNGFATVTIAPGTPGEVVKIVDARNTRRYDMRKIRGEDALRDPTLVPTVEEVVTITYQLRHVSAREVANALRPLIDANMGGQIIGIEGSEVIVLTDYAPNASRLLWIMAGIDVAPREPFVHAVVPVRHGSAEKLADRLDGAGGGIDACAVVPVSVAEAPAVVVVARHDAALRQVVNALRAADAESAPAGKGK